MSRKRFRQIVFITSVFTGVIYFVGYVLGVPKLLSENIPEWKRLFDRRQASATGAATRPAELPVSTSQVLAQRPVMGAKPFDPYPASGHVIRGTILSSTPSTETKDVSDASPVRNGVESLGLEQKPARAAEKSAVPADALQAMIDDVLAHPPATTVELLEKQHIVQDLYDAHRMTPLNPLHTKKFVEICFGHFRCPIYQTTGDLFCYPVEPRKRKQGRKGEEGWLYGFFLLDLGDGKPIKYLPGEIDVRIFDTPPTTDEETG